VTGSKTRFMKTPKSKMLRMFALKKKRAARRRREPSMREICRKKMR
jgi:hypothetical protein